MGLFPRCCRQDIHNSLTHGGHKRGEPIFKPRGQFSEQWQDDSRNFPSAGRAPFAVRHWLKGLPIDIVVNSHNKTFVWR
jgi:hypothetical protein